MRLFVLAPLFACTGDGPDLEPDPEPSDTGEAVPADTGEAPLPTEGDGGDALGPRFQSGTRLAARSIGAAGADERIFAYFHDTQLDTPCRFVLATDEVLRCLPSTEAGERAYLDDECFQAVDVYRCADPSYQLLGFPLERDDECDPFRTVFEVREVAPAAEQPDALFQADPFVGSCGPWPGSLPTVVDVGDLVDPETFVGATIRERVTQQGFGVREIVADDGAVLRQELFTETDGTCAMRYLGGLGPRCVPARTALLGAGPGVDWWFGDEACEVAPLAYTSRNPCLDEAPRLALEFADFQGPRPWRVGEPYTEETAYEDQTGECTQQTVAETPWTLYTVLGPATEQTLPATRLEIVPGSPVSFARFVDQFGLWLAPGFPEGRLGRGAGGPFVRSDGTACSALVTEDHGVRCVDGDVLFADDFSVRYFADPACTDRVVQTIPGEVPSALVLATAESCVPRGDAQQVGIDVLAVGGPYAGSTLYRRSSPDAVCEPAPLEPTLDYYDVGDSIVETLPELTVE